MRFAAAPVPPSEPRSAAADFLLRLTGGKTPAASAAAQVRAAVEEVSELPAELDQRVRLIGEW